MGYGHPLGPTKRYPPDDLSADLPSKILGSEPKDCGSGMKMMIYCWFSGDEWWFYAGEC